MSIVARVLEKLQKYAEEQDANATFEEYLQDQENLAQLEMKTKLHQLQTEREKYYVDRKKGDVKKIVKAEDKAKKAADKQEEQQIKEQEKMQKQQEQAQQQQMQVPYPSFGGATTNAPNAFADPNALQQKQASSNKSQVIRKVIIALQRKSGYRKPKH